MTQAAPANTPDPHAQARSFADRKAWAELLEFAKVWQQASPGVAKAWFFQGVALGAMGRYLEATTVYQRALELDSKDVKAWNNLAQIYFEVMGKPQDAYVCLERMVLIEPENKIAWSNLASLNGRLGRLEEALACAERALAIDPNMVEAQLHRARAAQMLGRSDLLKQSSAALAQVPAEQFRRTQ